MRSSGRLKETGLQFEIREAPETFKSEKLKGMIFVVSGTFTHYSRDEIKKAIGENGGKNAGSVSSKTTYLLAGENTGPEKLKKAKSLGIPVISESDFQNILM